MLKHNRTLRLSSSPLFFYKFFMSTSTPPPSQFGTIKEIFQWRRKKLSLAVVLGATLTWLLFQVSDYKLVSLVAHIAILLVTCVFLYSNVAQLLGKEVVIPKIEISEKSALETAHMIRYTIEEPVRDWRVFLESIVSLSVLSVIGSCFDFLTFLYIGVMVGFTVLVFYVKYEKKINECWERLRSVARSCYQKIDDKFLKKIKSKVAKEKKTD